MTKIPVLLITGFLGSGKTTLLKCLAADRKDLRLVFLLNEFSEVNVDAEALLETSRPIESVVGGSLFCECKAGEFVRVMGEVVRPMNDDAPIDAVVIETSGIADPEAIGRIFSDYGLTQWFEVRRIVSVVAPARFLKLIHNLPNIGAQIRTSDLVIINKVDVATEEEIAAAQDKIRSINPSVQIETTSYCQVALDLVGESRRLPLAELSTCESNPYTTRSIWVDHPVELEAFSEWLASLDPKILRIKGSVPTDQGWQRVERTVDGLEITPRPTAGSRGCLVFIVPDTFAASLEDCADALAALALKSGE